MRPPTALVAEDEPLLREGLVRLLKAAWPELEVVAQVRSGREAVEAFEAKGPDVCFLDVHMPGLSGVEAGRRIGRRAHLVFVTAFDQYAVQAFEQGAIDYLVKPVEPARLADTVARLKERLQSQRPLPDPEDLLAQLAARLERKEPLRWIQVSAGKTLRMVSVDDVDYLRSDEKYTKVAWTEPGGPPAEGLLRTPLKELLARLDPEAFTQVHRGVVVNLRAVRHLVRGPNETAEIHLRNRSETLPVSRGFLHLFKSL